MSAMPMSDSHSAPRSFFQTGSFQPLPLDPCPWNPRWFSGLGVEQLLWAFLWLGIAARGVRYALRFPLWEDECFLCFNLIDRGYLELLRPLDYHQVAPFLFLWVQKTAVNLLGFNEYSLRLFPFLCGIASLFLFWRLAKQFLQGTSLLLAAAILAVSYPGIRYASEAKQYGSDLLVSLVLLTLMVRWARDPAKTRRLWGLAALLPISLGLSYPAVFIAGALSPAAAWVLYSSAARRGWTPWLAYNLSLAASFALVLAVAAQGQSAAELGFMRDYWNNAFPQLSGPLAFLKWCLLTHTGELVSYPVGGERGAGTLTALCCLAGIVVFFRRRAGLFLLVGLFPPALNFIAAALHRYPYGGHQKFSLYLAPLICIAAGLGAAAWISLLQSRPRAVRNALAFFLVLPALFALGTITRDIACPYKARSDFRARAFAQWFWPHAQSEGETACLKTDLDLVFAPRTYRELGWSAMYLCNQRIYSPRHSRGEPLRLETISLDHPLRCLQYRDSVSDFDQSALDDWLDQMKRRYRLVSQETFSFPRYDRRDKKLVTVDYVDVYKFVPRVETAAPAGTPTVVK